MHKNTLSFWIIVDFEADNENDISSISNKTTKIYKQNPVVVGYYIEAELDDVLISRFYESNLDYDNVDWFVDEAIR